MRSSQAMNTAAAIIPHLNNQKVIMLSVCVGEPCTGATALSNRRVRLLIIESKSEDGIIYRSAEVTQKHISEKKVGQSYPIPKDINLMHDAAEMGFSTLETTTTTNNCTVRCFQETLITIE